MTFDFSKKPGRISFNRNLVRTEAPLVSVITPYYNAKKYFKELYPCVVNQTFPWFEWIIVDDGSNQLGEQEFLKDTEFGDPRIKVIHKSNGGISSARNVGIKNSSTDIIITLDADELIEPTYFELLYWALYYNSSSAWAYTDSLGFQNQEYVWQHPFDAKKLKSYNFLVESAAIRKKDLLEVGCYDEIEKNYFEDWRLWLKMLSKSKSPVHINSLEFWYRRTDTGVLNTITTNFNIKQRADDLIHEVALTADDTVVAKTFNGSIPRDCFVRPQKSEFDKPYLVKKIKKEILIFISSMQAGGISCFNLNLLRLINKDVYNVTIVATENSDNSWKQKFREYSAAVYTLSDFLDVKNYAEFISYIIQTRKIDTCIISNSYYAYYLLPWLKEQYPILDVIDYVHLVENYWREGGFARTSMAMSDFIDRTYTSSNATKKALITNFSRKTENLETLYIGVDPDEFDPETVLYGTVREHYHIPNDGKVVLFPCLLHARKRPYLMLEIAKKVIERNPNFYFIIVGDGFEKDGLLQQIDTYRLNKNVLWAGFQDDVRPFYKDADVTLICSLAEGISLAAYESCAMETPVITANVGGECELIKENIGISVSAFQKEQEIDDHQYSTEEIMQYVDAIFSLLDNSNQEQYQRMCENGRKAIKDMFHFSDMTKKIEAALEIEKSRSVVAKHNIQKDIVQFPALSSDIISLYIAYEGLNQENSRVWNERCYFQKNNDSLVKKIEQTEETFAKEKNERLIVEKKLESEHQKLQSIQKKFDDSAVELSKTKNDLHSLIEETDLQKKAYENEISSVHEKLKWTEEQMHLYATSYANIQNSISYKIGRMVTKLPRLVLKTIRFK